MYFDYIDMSTFIVPSVGLEVGDYFPFVSIELCHGQTKHMHNFCDNKDIMFFHCQHIDMIPSLKRVEGFHVIVLFSEGEPSPQMKPFCCKDPVLYSLFTEHETIQVYYLTPNRKIYKSHTLDSIEEWNVMKIEKNIVTPTNVPFLLIENVLSPALLESIENFYNANENRVTTHAHAGKNRHHVHPNRDLEIMIDNKLSRSVFPEIMKVFYFDVKYRESYKICRYNAETGGRFQPHRDTPHPYQHRRFAMSLFLNDDYEGGEFELPEYNFKIKPKANCALVFPGISTHKVNQVTKGTRKVIITFFCSEIEGKTKNNSTYSVKSDFFRDHEIKYSNIYPI